LPQVIIDLTGFEEYTNKPGKKHMASEKASDNKVEEVQHTIHASPPINLSSSANHHQAYSPSSCFDSPEANIMFKTQAAIQNQIKLFCSAKETANSLLNVLEETDDREGLLDFMTEGQKHQIRTKIIILILHFKMHQKTCLIKLGGSAANG
jgi:hypothetical protein